MPIAVMLNSAASEIRLGTSRGARSGGHTTRKEPERRKVPEQRDDSRWTYRILLQLKPPAANHRRVDPRRDRNKGR